MFCSLKNRIISSYKLAFIIDANKKEAKLW